MPSPRFVVLEDHPLVREALTDRLVSHWGDVVICYSGSSVSEALTAMADQGADCIILDLDLGDGRSAAVNISALTRAGVPILIVSALGGSADIRASLTAGALGYVSKNVELPELLAAIEATLRREPYTSSEVAAALISDTGTSVALSDQERRAMVLYASGLKMRAVAHHLGVAEGTAREYIKRVRAKYDKAGAPLLSKTDMYRMAQREGLVP